MQTFLPFDCGLPEQHAPKKKRRPRTPEQVIFIREAVNRAWLNLSFSVGRQWPAHQPLLWLQELLAAIVRHWLFKLALLLAGSIWSMTVPISDGTLAGLPLDPWRALVTRP
jgi:hypothetical protein